MRSLYEDILDWMLVTIHYTRNVDYLKLDKLDRDDMVRATVSKVNEMRRMIHREKSEEIVKEAESLLQNMLLSLYWLTRDEKSWKRIWHYQLTFFLWNFKCLVKWHLEENNEIKDKAFVDKYIGCHMRRLNENKLIILWHLSDEAELLQKNVACLNYIKKAVGKTELVTLAESEQEADWLEKISNQRKIRVFCPMEKYYLPPVLFNGEYVLDIPKSAMLSENVAKIIPYMIQSSHEIYLDGQGVKLSKTIKASVPFYGEGID